MSAIRKERTPEQIEAAKARMVAVRAKKGKAKRVYGLHETPSGMVGVVSPKMAKDIERAAAKIEHKRSTAIPNEFEGMTAKDCCDSCYAAKGERCAITHRAICGHPMKGGLQQHDQMRSDTVERYNRAKKMLAHAKIDLS